MGRSRVFTEVALEWGLLTRRQIRRAERRRDELSAAQSPVLLAEVLLDQGSLSLCDLSACLSEAGGYRESIDGDRPLLGDAVVESGFATPLQVLNCLKRQRDEVAMGGARRPLGKILVEAGYLLSDALTTVLRRLGGPEARSGASRSDRLLLARRELHPPTVVLVGGEPGLPFELRLRLARDRLDLRAFDTSVAALDAAREIAAALWVVVDGSPSGNGIDFVIRLRRTPSHATTPVLLCHRESRRVALERAAELGADVCHVAPLRTRDLASRIRKALGHTPTAPSALGALVHPQLTGVFLGDELLEVVQMMGVNSRRGVLHVTSTRLAGSIAFDGGKIVDAKTSALRTGLEAVQDLLRLRHGRFEFLSGLAPAEGSTEPPGLSLEVDATLLELLRQRDESSSVTRRPDTVEGDERETVQVGPTEPGRAA